MKFVMDNIYLVVVALVSGSMLAWPLLRRGSGGHRVSASDAVQLINRHDALVIDIREPNEYAVAHIINSRNVPLKEIDTRVKEIARYKEKPVIVACESGNRAGGGVAALKKLGFTQVYTLSGGLGAWQQAGLPTEK
ncbi:MAG: rhodanese-like domain-containing protein [Burkholderiales bacterium]